MLQFLIPKLAKFGPSLHASDSRNSSVNAPAKLQG